MYIQYYVAAQFNFNLKNKGSWQHSSIVSEQKLKLNKFMHKTETAEKYSGSNRL